MKVRHIHRHFARLRNFAGNHRVLTWAFTILFLVVVGAGVYFILGGKRADLIKPFIPAKQETVKYYSPLTGLQVTNQSDTTKPVTGIMVENSPDARPQSGLKNSGVVFEAIAEGGITRFLALYQQEKPQLIGPVRSLRFYDIDWLAPFDASIGHVGGSAAALAEIRNGTYRDLDQFFNGDSYWRSTDRYAPHNVYTSFKLIDALNKSKGYTSSNFTGFKHTDESPVKKPDAANISINISGYLYNSNYYYQPKTNSYNRWQAGAPHLDREAGQISPKVVVAMMVNEKTVYQDGWRESIQTSGEGKAYIFQNGTVIQASWHKATHSSQLQFTDSSGNEVALVRGQTWLAAVPNNGGGVSWK